MAVNTYLFILFNIINVITSEDCIINNRTPENAWEQTLERHLRCDKSEIIYPSFSLKEINVSVAFILKYFSFEEVFNEFSIQTWIFMSWRDDKLKWNPEDFHGLKDAMSDNVWIPSLRLFKADEESMEYFSSAPCNIKSSGTVICVVSKHHYVTCRVKTVNWPYDVQKCEMIFGIWPEFKERGLNVTLSFKRRAIGLEIGQGSADWTMIDYEQSEDKNSDQQLRMIFSLERKPSVITAIIIYPCLIVTTITLMCLFLDVRKNVRLGLVGLSIAGHFECLTEIGSRLPSNTYDVPTILHYAEGSIILTAVTGLLTVFLGFLCKKETKPYEWMCRFNSVVLNGYGRFLIWIQWEVEDISKDVKFSVEWINFACILNRVCTVLIIIAYVCLYIALMPRPLVLERSEF